MSSDKDRVFFYNYSIVIGLLAVMIIIFLVLALYLGVDEDAVALKQSTKVSANTVPVGVVNLLDEDAEAVEAATVATVAAIEEPGDMGQRVYNGLCISCHNGLPNIPKVGDKAAWESRIAQGMALLYEHSIKGFISEGGLIAMPPKGGNMNLTDEEVKAAVDYMVANSQ
ncbi:MAG: c-type cytochrome [Gammaproteobacteria bacterium]|nr:c-type cytochrome [Gammaproteobacteria bacterium]MDE0514579.1 c-type cytochrome [Gammaproteobacteria bacterium]